MKSWARPKRGSTGAAGTLAVEKTEGAEEEPMMCEETEARRWEGEEVEGEDEDEVGEGAMMIFIYGGIIIYKSHDWTFWKRSPMNVQ